MGSTHELLSKLFFLSSAEVDGVTAIYRTVGEEEAPANYVPAAAVIRRGQALSGITGRKGRVGGNISQM